MEGNCDASNHNSGILTFRALTRTDRACARRQQQRPAARAKPSANFRRFHIIPETMMLRFSRCLLIIAILWHRQSLSTRRTIGVVVVHGWTALPASSLHFGTLAETVPSESDAHVYHHASLWPSSTHNKFPSPFSSIGRPTFSRSIRSHRRTNLRSFSSSVTCTSIAIATQLGTIGAKYGSFILDPHHHFSYCLTGLFALSTFGVALEQRTVLGKALSAPLATMMLALLVANCGFMPFHSTVYTAINQYIVPLTVPLLLFDSDLVRVVRDTGSMLVAFLVGAVATLVGTLVAYPFWPLHSLGSVAVGRHVALALTARHIGGAINFVAVADTLAIPAAAVSAAIAADNVVVALYFAFLFAVAKPGESDGASPLPVVEVAESNSSSTGTKQSIPTVVNVGTVEGEFDLSTAVPTAVVPSSTSTFTSQIKSDINLSTLGTALATSSALVTVGGIVTKALLPSGTSALPMTSLFTVIAATAFPRYFQHLRQAGQALGILGIQMFFAASGCAGSIRLVMQQAPSLFAFSFMQVSVHFLTLIIIGRGLCRLPPRELYLASNANVGGPTTAAAMAQAKEWPRLVLPALLVGILGYATATGLALALGPVLARIPFRGA